MAGSPLDDLRETFDSLYGLEILEASSELVRARVAVTDRIKQPHGLVHGGVFCTIAETLASAGTMIGVRDGGNVAMGMSNHTTFLRPMTSGTIHAEAWPRHRGRSTWVWDVDITDAQGRLCATSRMTIAVRPAPS